MGWAPAPPRASSLTPSNPSAASSQSHLSSRSPVPEPVPCPPFRSSLHCLPRPPPSPSPSTVCTSALPVASGFGALLVFAHCEAGPLTPCLPEESYSPLKIQLSTTSSEKPSLIIPFPDRVKSPPPGSSWPPTCSDHCVSEGVTCLSSQQTSQLSFLPCREEPEGSSRRGAQQEG